MKHLLPRLAVALPFAALSLVFASLPASAQTLDETPPEIGIVSPQTFAVRNAIVIQATVSDTGGLNGCTLFVNGTNAGAMAVRSGSASLTQVFMTPETRNLQVRCQDGAGNVAYSAVTAMQAEAPAIPPAGTLPLGFEDGMLVRLSCLPEERQDAHCTDVYFVGHDGKRHAFQSQDAFRSWYPAQPAVLDVSLAALARLPLGRPISAAPGRSAIRFLSQPMIYAVTGPLHLRRFPDDAMTQSVLGPDWQTRVDVLTDSFYGNFTFGPDLTTPNEIPGVHSPDDVL